MLLLSFPLFVQAAPQEWSLLSPDGKLAVTVQLSDGQLSYSIVHDQTPVLQEGRLSMQLSDGRAFGTHIRSLSAKRSEGNISKSTPIYRKQSVSENFRALTLKAKNHAIEFMAFNEGLAYHFVSNMKDSLYIKDEQCSLLFPDDLPSFYLPLHKLDSDFQSFYEHTPLSSIATEEVLAPQLVVELNDGKRAFFTDFNIRDYPTMFLQHPSGNMLSGRFAKYPDEEEAHGGNLTRLRVKTTKDYIAHVSGQRAFPWRVLLVTTDDAHLLNNDVLCCLADPAEGVLSWVKPGKASWEWWNACNLTGVPFRTGVNNDTYKYYIDFASRNGIEYILMDEGWTLRQQPMDLLKTIPEIDLPMLIAYAKERGVGIILWSDFLPLDRNMEHIISEYARMGIKGFKIDHINRNDQKVVDFVERTAKMCAKYHMLVDFHGVFPPTGLQFTYPNVLNYEAVMGLEITKGRKELDLVTHECIVPFTRQVVGPIDYTQGAMRNATKADYHASRTSPMSQGTRCRQLAEYVIFESPFNMLCDSPTLYEKNQPSMNFIGKVPVVWDETRVISAKMAEYVVIARRKGHSWYLGGITNWQKRTIDIDLSFISGNHIQLYCDGVNADKNAEDYQVTTIPFAKHLTIEMAPGGGFSAIID